MTDEKIMELISRGDRGKIAILFERYHVALYNFFYKRNIDNALCEDLTQNVFVRILKYQNSFDASYSFRAWMYRIARNILNDHFSKKIKIQELKSDQLSIPTENVLDRIEEKERLSQLRQAMKLLDAEDRELIELSRFQKLKYQEIGEVLNIKEGAVKTRMYRAMKKLKMNYLKLEKK